MSLHINRFLDKIKMLEDRKAKDFTMSLREAKDLHRDITKLLLALHELTIKKPDTPTKIEISGDNW